MGLRFLSANPINRIRIVQEGLLAPFVRLAQSPLLDYQRTAAAAFSSFSLNEENKMRMVREGALSQVMGNELFAPVSCHWHGWLTQWHPVLILV